MPGRNIHKTVIFASEHSYRHKDKHFDMKIALIFHVATIHLRYIYRFPGWPHENATIERGKLHHHITQYNIFSEREREKETEKRDKVPILSIVGCATQSIAGQVQQAIVIHQAMLSIRGLRPSVYFSAAQSHRNYLPINGSSDGTKNRFSLFLVWRSSVDLMVSSNAISHFTAMPFSMWEWNAFYKSHYHHLCFNLISWLLLAFSIEFIGFSYCPRCGARALHCDGEVIGLCIE